MKLIFKLTFIGIAFAVIPSYSFAQSNYKAGYIVTLKGDTIKAFILYSDWNNNPTTFKFKEKTDSQDQKIDITTTKAIGIDDLDYFERNRVSISTDEVQIAKISTGVDSNKIINDVFLRVLAKGKYVNLYSYTDNIKTRYYYSENYIAGAHEFTYHIFYPVNDPTNFVETKSESQLFYLANKYNPAVIGQLRGINYTKEDMLKATYLINGDEGKKQFKNGGKSVAYFFVGAGASSSNLKYENYYALDHPDYNKTYVLPYLTAGVSFYPNKITQKLLFKFQLNFVSDQHEIYTSPHAPVITETTLKFKQYTMGLLPQIIYNFYSKNALKVYAGIGASVNLSIYKDYQYIVHTNDGFTDRTNVTQLIPFDYLWVSPTITAGVVINKRIDLNLYYFTPATFGNYSDKKSNITSYRAGINYLF